MCTCPKWLELTCNHAGEQVRGTVVVVVEDATHEEEREVVDGPTQTQPGTRHYHAPPRLCEGKCPVREEGKGRKGGKGEKNDG